MHPVKARRGRYLVPSDAGYSAEIFAESLDDLEFPGGAEWRA